MIIFYKIKALEGNKRIKEDICIYFFFFPVLPTASAGVRFAGFGSVSKHTG